MYFFNICKNPDILRIIYFGMKILDFIFLIIPMLLIIYVTIDIVKIIINVDDKIKTIHKSIINRIIFAIALFFVPTIVTIIMNILTVSNINTEYKSCITNANKSTINALQIQKDIIENKQNNNVNNNISSGNIYNDLANKMVQVATAELGTQNGKNNSNKYGADLGYNNVAWCAIFVTWVAQNTTVNNVNLYEDIITKNANNHSYASTAGNITHFYKQSNLQFQYSEHYGGNYIPKAGDYIFFDFENEWNKKMEYNEIKKAAKHTGMVIESKNGKVYTIEGNTGKPGTVKKKEYNLNSSSIMGYGSWYN